MTEGPDPANSQGQEAGDSSETWTSWLNTCSPVQRTLLTAYMMKMCKRIYKYIYTGLRILILTL